MTREEDIEFQKIVMEGLVPKLEASQFAVAICPQGEDRLDAKFCVELGAMVMMDKPIIAIIQPGGYLPKKLELVADKIVHADIGTPEGQALLLEAIKDSQDSL